MRAVERNNAWSSTMSVVSAMPSSWQRGDPPTRESALDFWGGGQGLTLGPGSEALLRGGVARELGEQLAALRGELVLDQHLVAGRDDPAHGAEVPLATGGRVADKCPDQPHQGTDE